MPKPMDFVSNLPALMARAGFDHFGLTPLSRPLTFDLYREWLEAGHNGEMDYLSAHADLKENPQKLAPRARSAIVVAKAYFPHPYPDPPGERRPQGRTALYARGQDYHSAFRRELEDLRALLQVESPDAEFLCFTDSAPILERDLAARAGLGWFGKNTCLIHPQKGSLFFIGEILTSLHVAAAPAPIADLCGTCDRCIRACPTQAIEAPRVLNANKCIAYWTIEAKGPAPIALREKFGDWFFGCDICQTVCPWNEKVFGREQMLIETAGVPDHASLVSDLRWLLTRSNKTLAKEYAPSPLSRARANGLKRNAMIVAGNLKLIDLKEELEKIPPSSRHFELARWSLAQMLEGCQTPPAHTKI